MRKTFKEIVLHYRMINEAAWVIRNNPGNDNPYHGLFHAQCMVINCYEGALYHNLPWTATRSLLMAALFHDYNHSGGSSSDGVNIELALTGYERAMIEWGDIEPIVVDCIRCTEYPFIAELDPYTIEQKIIRDADLMQYRFDNWDEMYFHSLKAEMEVKVGHPISDEGMLAGNRMFWKDVQIFTDWGKASLNAAPHSFREKMAIQDQWYHNVKEIPK